MLSALYDIQSISQGSLFPNFLSFFRAHISDGLVPHPICSPGDHVGTLFFPVVVAIFFVAMNLWLGENWVPPNWETRHSDDLKSGSSLLSCSLGVSMINGDDFGDPSLSEARFMKRKWVSWVLIMSGNFSV